jgi:acyl transferase domain-containing protein
MSASAERLAQLSPEKRALLALRQMQARLDAAERARHEPIAIIGMGCRFPGDADSPERFWRLLRDGVDAIREIPPERWDVAACYDPDPAAGAKMHTRWGGFLRQVDQFDARFFGITAAEAAYIDPQQRLLLEVAWEALERAGQPVEQLAGSATGLFIGISSSDYFNMQIGAAAGADGYVETGTRHSFVARRLAYLLDLRGPSVVIDTICSSSLVGVHLACQSLRNNECDLALAGGVNLILSPLSTILTAKLLALAPDGRCKTFDARANGHVRSEGCGVVALKRLSDARAAGDPILALIRGSAINQDGRSTGLTAPNVLAQQDVIRRALANAGVAPAQIGYVETHGTGTALGDPIEVEALTDVLGGPRADGQVCVLGAVKTAIGHLDAAAGIAGLIKAVLCLEHAAIPPNLHFTTLNPHIALEQTPFVIPTALHPWPAGATPRYAGVSAFSLSGTNAHIVLEEAPSPPAAPHTDDRAYVLPLSARSPAALRALARDYQALLTDASEQAASLHDLCYTAGVRRSHHDERWAGVANSKAALAEQLRAFTDAAPPTAPAPAAPMRRPKLAFVFADAGLAPLSDALAQEPVFRTALAQCDEAIRTCAGWSPLAEGAAGTRQAQGDRAAALLFAVQVALAALWRAWGIEPQALVGQGMGAVAAAHVAGVLELADAARIVCTHSRSAQPVQLRPPSLPLYPSWPSDRPLDAAGWAQLLGESAPSAALAQQVVQDGYTLFLEIGPRAQLSAALAHAADQSAAGATILPSLHPDAEARSVLLASLGALYTLGFPVDWRQCYPTGGRCVRAPTYPWQRERHWVAQAPAAPPAIGTGAHPLLGRRLRAPLPSFEAQIARDQPAFLAEQRVFGTTVLPAAAYIELALAAAAATFAQRACVLEDMVFQAALALPAAGARTIQMVLTPASAEAAAFQLFSLAGDAGDAAASEWQQHASGQLRAQPLDAGTTGQAQTDLETLSRSLPAAEMDYRGLGARGVEYGASFRGIERLWRRDGEALGQVALPAALLAEAGAYQMHPALLEAGLQVMHACMPDDVSDGAQVALPAGLERLWFAGSGHTRLWSHAVVRQADRASVIGDLRLFDERGQLVIAIAGLLMKRVSRSTAPSFAAPDRQQRPQPQTEQPALLQQLATAAQHERRALLLAFVLRAANDVLGRPAAQPLEPHQRLFEAGMTSIMAVAFRDRLQAGVGQPLRSTLVFSYPTVAAIVEYLAVQVLALEPPAAHAEPRAAAPPATDAVIAQLSEDEAEALLAERLADFEKRV